MPARKRETFCPRRRAENRSDSFPSIPLATCLFGLCKSRAGALGPGFDGVTKHAERGFEFGAGDFHARSADLRATDSHFLLNEFDELYKFRNRIQPQQRKKPAIQLKRLVGLPVPAVLEQIHRLPRKS